MSDGNEKVGSHRNYYSAKEVHLPFLKFPGVIPVLGPEMKSTGESMGIDADPYLAYYRAQLGANVKLPLTGTATLIGTGLETLAQRLETLGYTVTLLETSSPDTALPRAAPNTAPMLIHATNNQT